MTNTMTRKAFMQTIGGLAASAYVPALAPMASGATKPAVKMGASIYSYNGDFNMETMNLEKCIADVSDMGAEGIEILGQSHVPDFPNPADQWVQRWFDWMAKYKTKPVVYDGFIDTKLYKNRPLTLQEIVDQMVVEFKLANKLGLKVFRGGPGGSSWRYSVGPKGSPWESNISQFDVLEKALPYAEKYDVIISGEIHSPARLNDEFLDRTIAFIEKTKTKHLGFTLDMSIFVKQPPRHQRARLLEQGARENIVQYIIKAYQEDLGAEKTMAEVKKMGGSNAEVRFASDSGIYHFSHNNPKDVAKVLPYIVHTHAKFYEMTDDAKEYSIPEYGDVVAVMARGGYTNYFHSEYEGLQDAYRASRQLRLQHLMIRQAWDSA
jgi:sugar phosphate isomerase/epimerase